MPWLDWFRKKSKEQAKEAGGKIEAGAKKAADVVHTAGDKGVTEVKEAGAKAAQTGQKTVTKGVSEAKKVGEKAKEELK